MKTLILIPSRMASQRFPDKPMAKIDGIPMIQRVWEQANKSNLGKVIVACCDNEVKDLIKSLGGDVIMTDPNIPTGTDRIFAAIQNYNNISDYDNIVNLQGDMPIINPMDIVKVNTPLKQGFDIGTLVTDLKYNEHLSSNITKAEVSWIKKNIIGKATSFYRMAKTPLNNLYHHVGIYSFRFETLKKFVSFHPSKNEVKYKLEQLRALDHKMTIGVNYVKNVPISVDTKEDLIKVEKLLK